MDALIVEIMQLCLLLERQGKITKISWHSASLGRRGSILVEYWRNRSHYQLWLDNEEENIEHFSSYTTYSADSATGLQRIITKLKEFSV